MMRWDMQACGAAAMENALGTAARRHRAAFAAEDERRRQGFEFRFLLARLGFGAADLDAVSVAASAAALPARLRGEIARRLGVESARLKRLARSGGPRYDLNRHLAVHRALLWAAGDAKDLGACRSRSGHLPCARGDPHPPMSEAGAHAARHRRRAGRQSPRALGTTG